MPEHGALRAKVTMVSTRRKQKKTCEPLATMAMSGRDVGKALEGASNWAAGGRAERRTTAPIDIVVTITACTTDCTCQANLPRAHAHVQRHAQLHRRGL